MNISNIEQVMNMANFQSISQDQIETTAANITNLPPPSVVDCHTSDVF